MELHLLSLPQRRGVKKAVNRPMSRNGGCWTEREMNEVSRHGVEFRFKTTTLSLP